MSGENNAKMREALMYIDKLLYASPDGGLHIMPEHAEDVRRTIKSALAAPPRNCDRFNTGDHMKDVYDAYDAWQRYCDDPTIPPSCKVESAFKYWLFAKVKEGGAK